MPPENQNTKKRDIRLIIDNAETGKNIVDEVVLNTDADPTHWKHLPGFLKEGGEIVEVQREQMLKDVFRLRINPEN